MSNRPGFRPGFPKTNMNRGGYVRDLYVDDVTLAHGVSTTPLGYGATLLPNSPTNASVMLGVVTAASANPPASQGGLITLDCDFGTPAAAGPASTTQPGPIYAYKVHDIVSRNVTIAGTVYNTTIADTR